jgi:diguanylate cyclase (GGDEF)-like protein
MLLQEVAKRLESSLPASDVLARLGGDEFAVVVPAMTSLDNLEKLAKEIVEAIVRPLRSTGIKSAPASASASRSGRVTATTSTSF